MATNKELVEQAVGAIPKWMAFLDKKEAEQNLILEQMQDDDSQFAPKTLTQRLADRFTTTKDKPEPIDQVSNEKGNKVKLEKETSIKPQEEEKTKVVEKTKKPEVVEETEVAEALDEFQPVSSQDNETKVSQDEFKDLF